MSEVTITMPLTLTPEMIRAVRDDPTTCTASHEAWHARLGWLLCAWDVLVRHRRMPDIRLDATYTEVLAAAVQEIEGLRSALAELDGIIGPNPVGDIGRWRQSHAKVFHDGQASTLDAGAEKV